MLEIVRRSRLKGYSSIKKHNPSSLGGRRDGDGEDGGLGRRNVPETERSRALRGCRQWSLAWWRGCPAPPSRCASTFPPFNYN